MKDTILHDAMQRDITTARRTALLEILWNERYLTRAPLIARVELRLGKNCFGILAWEDTFYRDMRFVKQVFEAARYQLLYSRKKEQPGYYLDGQPALSSEFKQILKGSAVEVDQRQIDIYRKLSFADAFARDVPSVIPRARWWLTEFARKTRRFHLLKQIGWHYRERIANDE